MQDTYSLLREIADSWVLLAMTVFFLGTIVWAFRPGSRAIHDDAAQTIFRDISDLSQPCDKNCADCACARTLEVEQ